MYIHIFIHVYLLFRLRVQSLSTAALPSALAHSNLRVDSHVCMYVCMHVCMYVYMYACMHICMYACMHVCMSHTIASTEPDLVEALAALGEGEVREDLASILPRCSQYI